MRVGLLSILVFFLIISVSLAESDAVFVKRMANMSLRSQEFMSLEEVWEWDEVVEEMIDQNHLPVSIFHAFAMLESHYSISPWVQYRFPKIWTQLTVEQKTAFFHVFNRWHARHFFGYQWHLITPPIRSLLGKTVTDDDVVAIGEIACVHFPEWKSKLQSDNEAFNKKIEQLRLDINNRNSKGYNAIYENFHVANNHASGNEKSLAELNALNKSYLTLILEDVRKNGWHKYLKNRGFLLSLGFVDSMVKSVGREDFLGLEALENLAIDAGLTAMEIDPRTPEYSVQIDVALALMEYSRNLTPVNWKREISPIDYKSVPMPVKIYFASLMARQGDDGAAEYLRNMLDKALRKVESHGELRRLEYSKEKKDKEKIKALENQIDRDFVPISFVVRIAHPETYGFQDLYQRMQKAKSVVIVNNIASYLSNSKTIREQYEGIPYGGYNDDEKLLKINQKFKNGEINLFRYAQGMRSLGKLDDRRLINAALDRPGDINLITDKSLQAEIIYHDPKRRGRNQLIAIMGGPVDHVNYTIATTIALRNYIKCVPLRRYTGFSSLRHRLPYAHAHAYICKPEFLTQLFAAIRYESDARALSYLGHALFTIAIDPAGENSILEMREIVKTEKDENLLLYVKRVLAILDRLDQLENSADLLIDDTVSEKKLDGTVHSGIPQVISGDSSQNNENQVAASPDEGSESSKGLESKWLWLLLLIILMVMAFVLLRKKKR